MCFFETEEIITDTPIDYIGWEVFEDKAKIGIVIDYFKQGSTDSLIVELYEGGITNLPMVKELIDIKKNKIKIKQKGLVIKNV